ncbi:MAG: replicative DNA helicase [Planctomycetota bacterium]
MIAQNDAPDRRPPQNLEAEHGVLGSMLMDREAIGDVLLVLDDDDFYMPANAEIFRTLVGLYDRNEPVDLVLATDDLKSRSKLDGVGGVSGLVEIMESVPNASHALAYAKLVREAADRRRLVEAATTILREAQEGGTAEVSDLIDSAEQRIYSIGQTRGKEDKEDMPSLIRTAMQRIDAMQVEGAETMRGLRTHFSDLDRMLNGLAPGALYVIAGRPSMGKTSFALNIMDHVCVRDGVPAMLFTLEVGKQQIAENMLCANARVDAHRLLRGELSDTEFAKVPEAAGRLSQAPIYIDDTPGLSVMRLRAKARRMKSRHDIGLIVVDYLQLLSLGASAESRQIEISRMSGALKQTARELEVPVIMLSQLNRGVEQRQDKHPMMGDLRESGSIEQDADAILLLYREEYYYPEKLEARGKAEGILAKNRNGPTGKFDMFFFPNHMRFENPTFIPDPGAESPPAPPAPATF